MKKVKRQKEILAEQHKNLFADGGTGSPGRSDRIVN